MRLVLDTNVVIAGLLWNGPPRRLIDAAIEVRIELAINATLLGELNEALCNPKFAGRIAQHATTVDGLLDRYAAIATLAPAASIAPTVVADPDDDEVLACALAAAADLVVSGDPHLLNLKHFHHMAIVNPAEALRRITGEP